MQYLNTTKESAWQIKRLTKHALLVLACLLIWFMPALHKFWQKIDLDFYAMVNQSLLYSRSWQLLWGYLNHPNETWLNLVVMATINIMGVIYLPKEERPRAIAMIIYFWLFFQLVLLLNQKLVINGLNLQRHSPSIVQYPWVVLSEALNIGDIKVYSHSCFPAGHVLVLVFWARFTALYCNAQLRKLVIFTAVLLTLPRLFSGAHWLSDVVFTTFYSLLWFELAVCTPLYQNSINFIVSKINPQVTYEKYLY